ncbi:MAG: NUDIX domain-containing protein [Candidatus Staskawiczbacteria bacterium]|nr:NUDIX domain-containing protein [Candidatus Staskawiczbacteria bacterium]
MKLVQKAVIKKGDKYLIQLRSESATHFPLYWDFPGGRLEEGEDSLDGIVREAKEETNLDIKPIKVLGVYEFNDIDNPDKQKIRFTIYSVKIISGELKISEEHLEQKWATKEEILKLPIEPYFEPFFKDNPE